MKRIKLYTDTDKAREIRRRFKERYRQRTGSSQDIAGITKKPYSEEEDRAIRLHEISDRELAKELGRSVGAIQKRRWVLGGGRKLKENEFNQWNASGINREISEKIKEEIRSGELSIKKIAEKYNVSMSAVRNRRQEVKYEERTERSS